MQYLIPMIVIFLFYHVLFIWSLQVKDFGVVDIGWAFSFSVLHYAHSMQNHLTYQIFTFMLTLWSLRLAHYLYVRWRASTQEDWRYAQLRSSWRPHEVAHGYFKVFILQAVLMLIIALPVWIINHAPLDQRPINAWGIIIFTMGFILESIADWQLYHFKKDPANHGRKLTRGVWKIPHANYRGEILIWTGLSLHVFLATGISLTLISPILLYFLMKYFSGEALLKKRLAQLK